MSTIELSVALFLTMAWELISIAPVHFKVCSFPDLSSLLNRIHQLEVFLWRSIMNVKFQGCLQIMNVEFKEKSALLS